MSRSADIRQVKNKLAQYLITLGGISVLFTLVLIFLYLLYVIKPIFESAHIEKEQVIQVDKNTDVLINGVEELKEVAYQLDSSGVITFYQLSESDFRPSGTKLLTQNLTEDNLAFAVDGSTGNKVLVDNNGYAYIVAPKFVASYLDEGRDITPQVNFPLGSEKILIDEEQRALTRVAFGMDDEKAVFVAFTEDQKLVMTTLIADDDFSYSPDFEASHQELSIDIGNVDELFMTPDLAMVFVRNGDQITVIDISDEYSIEVKEVIEPTLADQHYTSMALLSGGGSLLIGDNLGKVSQWFEVLNNKKRAFKEIRHFDVSETESVVNIVTEQFRKSFYTLTPSGELGVFYTTSEADLWHGKLSENLPNAITIAPRSDGLLITENGTLSLFSVENEHPEVTWSALWQEVWYEGYPEPDYIWQSTSGSDDFEAKFSLVPISFGTMKAAMYAMLFAVPIALSAAIYTAYFMPANLRKKVKPTIELMEALPTVILGFLAGLWLAPIIEDYLPAIFLLLLFLPLTTFITAYGWYKAPKYFKEIIPESWASIILIPFLILAGFAAFALSPVLEDLFFGGDVRQFITNDLGVNFDQRNSLVVGIAMGFAVIPTIFSMAEDAIFSVPKHLTSGSLALGATPWQTLVKVVLLTASPGIFSAVMMGLGRAVGETMIVLMATGNTPIVDWSIFQGMRTLAANIAVEMPESEVGSSHYRILFLAAFVLFVFTFIFNTLAEFVRQRLRDKYSSM